MTEVGMGTMKGQLAVTEYRYVVVLADGRVYDPDNPIDRKMNRVLELDIEDVEDCEAEEQELLELKEKRRTELLDDRRKVLEERCKVLEERCNQSKATRTLTEEQKKMQQAIRAHFTVKLNDLLAQGWVPLRETPLGNGCLLVLTRVGKTRRKPKDN